MRREIRRSYRCPCEGERWPPGREHRHPVGAAAIGALSVVRTVCGEEPPECPWHAWSDPEVAAVVSAWHWYDKGQLSTLLGDDPPHWLVEGVRVFGSALEAARADVQEQERRAREVSRGR